MKKYTPTYKTVTTKYWSFDFTVTTEEYEEVDVVQYFKEIIAKMSDFEIKDCLQCWDEDVEEVENEPDWDMLPGGKDYD